MNKCCKFLIAKEAMCNFKVCQDFKNRTLLKICSRSKPKRKISSFESLKLFSVVGVISKYLCGKDEFCNPKNHLMKHSGRKMKIFDGEKVRRAAERAKVNALRNYFTIGILEHFMTTLELFETILPKIFKGARAAYHSDCKS